MNKILKITEILEIYTAPLPQYDGIMLYSVAEKILEAIKDEEVVPKKRVCGDCGQSIDHQDEDVNYRNFADEKDRGLINITYEN